MNIRLKGTGPMFTVIDQNDKAIGVVQEIRVEHGFNPIYKLKLFVATNIEIQGSKTKPIQMDIEIKFRGPLEVENGETIYLHDIDKPFKKQAKKVFMK